jgi:hypothetical protein
MSIPADNLNRHSTLASADDPSAVHLSLVGNTYTIPVSGEDTAGRYSTCTCRLVVAHLLTGTIVRSPLPCWKAKFEATFRGENVTVRAGK